MKRSKVKKGAIQSEMIVWIAIAVALLALMLLVYSGFSGKLAGYGSHIRNFLRFGQ